MEEAETSRPDLLHCQSTDLLCQAMSVGAEPYQVNPVDLI